MPGAFLYVTGLVPDLGQEVCVLEAWVCQVASTHVMVEMVTDSFQLLLIWVGRVLLLRQGLWARLVLNP